MKKMAMGGRLASKGEHSVQTKSKRGAEMPKMKKGGSIDGCAVKGKTKGKMVKMMAGGMAKMRKGGAC
jgi:hypothetical protein